MKLDGYLDQRLSWVFTGVRGRDELLREMARRAAEARGLDGAALEAALVERERQHSTATPLGVALPHAIVPQAPGSFVALGRVADGPVDFAGSAVDLVVMLAGPPEGGWEHVRVLARVARLCNTPAMLRAMRAAADGAALHAAVMEEDRRHA